MMRLAFALAALALSAPLQAQTADEVSAAERARFGHGELRRGADGNDPAAPNYANFDEAKVGDLQPPPLFTSPAQASPEGWPERRAAIAQLVENEFVGRIPEAAADLRVVWSAQPENDATHMVGQVLSPHAAMGPVIDAVLTMPPGASGPVPAIVEYTYVFPPGFVLPPSLVPRRSMRTIALERGWAHVAYRPTMLQADDLAKLAYGVIAQARFPRGENDWGALRAWGWGASQLREHLASDPRIAGDRISLAGHSRFGKAVLVAAAFDHDFADALVSSSGAGGAKLMRRDLGERLENMADPYASIWYAPRIRHYAGKATVADWPVDAHMLMALRAPRPLFVATGLASEGDAWVDPRGQWLAVQLAQPAWDALGQPTPRTGQPLPLSREQARYPLAWYQHDQGHVMPPAAEAFIDHAEAFAP